MSATRCEYCGAAAGEDCAPDCASWLETSEEFSARYHGALRILATDEDTATDAPTIHERNAAHLEAHYDHKRPPR